MMQYLNRASRARRLRAAVASSRTRLQAQLRQAAGESDERFARAFARLLAACELGLGREQRVMDALGFSAAPAHREGNRRTLALLRQAAPLVAGGDLGTGRCALGLLAGVLPLHRFTVDLALISRLRHAPRRAPAQAARQAGAIVHEELHHV